ncbi:hypothetical protein [aff. Roholtiella sp. LEGE 12411]|nr:hypothetical protein [aff. Roholtiella sp. LEGE 12411]
MKYRINTYSIHRLSLAFGIFGQAIAALVRKTDAGGYQLTE